VFGAVFGAREYRERDRGVEMARKLDGDVLRSRI
jgi:hypothetical protein